jgi:hypothetical protein
MLNTGDLVRINPYEYPPSYEWYILTVPSTTIESHNIVGKFNQNHVGTVIEMGKHSVRILVGDKIGWISKSILCKVYE